MSATTEEGSETAAVLNYLAPETPSSLYRTGQLMLRRNADGSDSGLEGVILERQSLAVRNGRVRHDGRLCTLERNGFELLDAPLADEDLDFFGAAPVIEGYYGECAELVRSATGATQVFAFDHNVRSASGKDAKQRIEDGQEVQGPARVVHGDYTLTSAPDRLRQLAAPPTENDTYQRLLGEGETLLDPAEVETALESGRFAFINVWRNIDDQPVQSDPLALCDAQTVRPDDLVVFELHYSDRIGENYFSKHAPGHTWYMFPEMERGEAMLIKQWDSAGTLAQSGGKRGDATHSEAPSTFSFHTAFFDPETMLGKPPRWSIEVRCVAFY